MYLALLLDAPSEALVRQHTGATDELHLTVVHSRSVLSAEALAALPLPVGQPPVFTDAALRLPIETRTALPTYVGGKANTRHALVVSTNLLGAQTPGLTFRELRFHAEEILRRRSCLVSVQWKFTPHITLGKNLLYSIPSDLRLVFDRMEWRA